MNQKVTGGHITAHQSQVDDFTADQSQVDDFSADQLQVVDFTADQSQVVHTTAVLAWGRWSEGNFFL